MLHKKRTFALIALGVFGAVIMTLAVGIHEAGWPATKRQLEETVFALETAMWPAVSRTRFLLAPSATQGERDVWRFVITEYVRGPRGRNLAIAVNPVAEWPEREQEVPSQLADRILNGWSPRIGTPSAASAIQDFLTKNTRPVRVDVSLPSGSQFVPYATFARTSGERFGWEEFSGANHVEAYLSLSRVGFNMFGTHALIYVEISCGPLCGHGEYYILEKRRGKWFRVADQVKWVA